MSTVVAAFLLLVLTRRAKSCIPSYTPDFPGYNIPDTTTIVSPVETTTTSTTTTTTTTTTTSTTTTTTTTTTAACPGGGQWEPYTDINGVEHVYCYFPTPVLFDDAKMMCESIGGQLPSILDAGENNFVNMQCMMGQCWIGLQRVQPLPADCSNFVPTQMSCWYWTDGTTYEILPTGYTNWRPSQPDNFGGMEYCGQINWGGGTAGTWDAITCDGTLFGTAIPFICKKAA